MSYKKLTYLVNLEL